MTSMPPVVTMPECGTAGLTASISIGNGTAGSIYYNLVFTNVSGASCFMQGFPGVIAANMSGDLGDSAVRTGAAGARVTLAPHGKAVAILRYAEAATTTMGCGITAAADLSIIPPDQGSAIAVPFVNQVCGSASVSVLFIQALTG